MSKLLIISADFYSDIADELVKGACTYLDEQGASYELVSVPGAFEIPGVIALAEQHELYDGYVALGCVIRGETSHYDYVCGESARGLMELSLDGVAVGNGILTVEDKAQAWKRAHVHEKNKGKDAAEAALRMIAISEQFANE